MCDTGKRGGPFEDFNYWKPFKWFSEDLIASFSNVLYSRDTFYKYIVKEKKKKKYFNYWNRKRIENYTKAKFESSEVSHSTNSMVNKIH